MVPCCERAKKPLPTHVPCSGNDLLAAQRTRISPSFTAASAGAGPQRFNTVIALLASRTRVDFPRLRVVEWQGGAGRSGLCWSRGGGEFFDLLFQLAQAPDQFG